VAVERSAAQMLQWSWWRRWHQAWAAWHHARRRAAVLAPQPLDGAPPQGPAVAAGAEAGREAASTEATIAQVWARLEPLLPVRRRAGRQIVHDRRQILEAIVYVLQTDCGWSNIPSRYPPWKTVQAQFVVWRNTGTWDRIWQGVPPPGPRPLEELQL
jgi:hypothetical protein